MADVCEARWLPRAASLRWGVRAGLGSASQLLPNSDSLALCRYARSAFMQRSPCLPARGFLSY